MFAQTRHHGVQGHVESQYQIALLFERGLGVRQDLVVAHMWYNLAAAKGHAKSREFRDKIALKLNNDELAEAEGLAVDWWTSK